MSLINQYNSYPIPRPPSVPPNSPKIPSGFKILIVDSQVPTPILVSGAGSIVGPQSGKITPAKSGSAKMSNSGSSGCEIKKL